MEYNIEKEISCEIAYCDKSCQSTIIPLPQTTLMMKAHSNARPVSEKNLERILSGDTDLNWYNAQIQSTTYRTKRHGVRKRKYSTVRKGR